MRWFLSVLGNFFTVRRVGIHRRHLMGMYFDESNSGGRRKQNRERA